MSLMSPEWTKRLKPSGIEMEHRMNKDIVSEAATLIYQMNNEQLNEIVRTIKLKQKHVSEQASLQFRIGDTVQFDSNKLHRVVVGKITKINRKTIHVNTVDAGKWRVSPTMLSSVTDES